MSVFRSEFTYRSSRITSMRTYVTACMHQIYPFHCRGDDEVPGRCGFHDVAASIQAGGTAWDGVAWDAPIRTAYNRCVMRLCRPSSGSTPSKLTSRGADGYSPLSTWRGNGCDAAVELGCPGTPAVSVTRGSARRAIKLGVSSPPARLARISMRPTNGMRAAAATAGAGAGDGAEAASAAFGALKTALARASP